METDIFFNDPSPCNERDLLLDLLVRSGFKVYVFKERGDPRTSKIRYMFSYESTDSGKIQKFVIKEREEDKTGWKGIVYYWNRWVENEKQEGEVRLPDKIVLPSVMVAAAEVVVVTQK